jgi:hypothetical protein
MTLSEKEGNDLILRGLWGSKPFMAGKTGSIELDCIHSYLKTGNWNPTLKQMMLINTGFFPTDDLSLTQFCEIFLKSLKQLDVIATWRYEQDFLFPDYCTASPTQLRSLEPYYHENPWSQALIGKKVLVIHPYEKSIISQYANRRLLFKDPQILPDFSLDIVKAVQSIGGTKTEFNNWFEAYDSMCNQIVHKDFDIAITGAGSYGLPLAAFIKDIGKKAVHIGGAAQILFGIKGRRWDAHDVISLLYNEYWIRPSPEEIPANAHLIEEGCYW